MKLKALTGISLAVALTMGGFVPAPASVSVFAGAAEAANGSSQGSRKKATKRKGKKKKAPAAKSAANGAKKAARTATRKTSKKGPSRVAGKSASPKSSKSKQGRRNAGTFTGHAAAAVAGNGLLAVPTPAPRPGRAAAPPRKAAKKQAPPAKKAQATAKKTQRQAQNKTSKTAANPAGPGRRNSDVSSVLPRQPTAGGATETAARVERATQAAIRTEKTKQGKKSRFYWTGFFGRKKK